jgi:hypothetical protein
MGLDVRAFSRCRPDTNTGEDQDDLIHVYGRDFPERLDGRAEGYYVSDDEGFHFRAGSYTGYSRWREKLCRLALGVSPEETWGDQIVFGGANPFFELIHFSDCEGAIGPETSAKLLHDFDEWFDRASQATERGEWDEYDFRVYQNFKRAFTIAADGGFVVFT